MRALLYGASGELAQSVAGAFAARGWTVEGVLRGEAPAPAHMCTAHRVERRYSAFEPKALHDAYVFPQALFAREPLAEMTADAVDDLVTVGLTEIIQCLRRVLAIPAEPDRRIDYCVIGSTSAYAGFRNTSVYCAVKHGLVGLVRALNDEYAGTGRRFWLFSMGTMDTAMGRELVDQDPTSFLPPDDVAARIVEAVTAASNLFEPEVIIRRRTIRFLER